MNHTDSSAAEVSLHKSGENHPHNQEDPNKNGKERNKSFKRQKLSWPGQHFDKNENVLRFPNLELSKCWKIPSTPHTQCCSTLKESLTIALTMLCVRRKGTRSGQSKVSP